ncbi:MAG: hypothetical protein ACLTDV_03830 [Eubacterium sp.]
MIAKPEQFFHAQLLLPSASGLLLTAPDTPSTGYWKLPVCCPAVAFYLLYWLFLSVSGQRVNRINAVPAFFLL